jgi:hypothetical protein
MDVKIVRSSREDAYDIASRLREGDRMELQASSGREPLVALLRALSTRRCWTAVVAGVPQAMFGCADSQLDDYGSAWMLGTDWLDTREARMPIWRFSRRYVAKMHQLYPILFNYVDARNWRSLAWLQRLGFEVRATEPAYGVGKLPFHLLVSEHRV